MHSVTREQIAINQIAYKRDNSSPKLVLIKGAPGVGKTTLSWELCRRWSRGELWTDYSLVVLLRLRDENIQTATRLVDLFQCEDAGISEDIQSDIRSLQGSRVLFILEGLDELPQKYIQDTESIFLKLVAGHLLPSCTVVVTTRPWAMSILPTSCSSRLDQLIEILGFTDEQIQEYVSNMISIKEAPPEFQTYLDEHPQIENAMYNPLYARIVVEVFREYYDVENKNMPSTTTELYTSYCVVLVKRHLTNYPVEEEWNDDLWKLPQSLQHQFHHLCEIAYQGIDKQQLVFSKSDIRNAIDTLGFMNSVNPLYQSAVRKVAPSYHFIHLTLQEFLAAVHIWKNHTKQEQLIFFETKSEEGVILQFLAGLTEFNDPWTRCVLPVPKYDGECSNEKVWDLSTDSIILWLYESKNQNLLTMYKSVILRANLRDFRGYNYDITSFDRRYFKALGYILATGKFQISFDCPLEENDSCIIYHCISKSLGSELKASRKSSSTLKCLSLFFDHYCFFANISPLLLHFQTPSKMLQIHSEEKYITCDSSFYEYIKTVEEIELDNLSNGFLESLVSNIRLRRIKLNYLNDCQKLCTLVKESQSLKSLELTSTYLASCSFPLLECTMSLGLNALSLKQMKSLSSNFKDIQSFFRSLIFSFDGAGLHLDGYESFVSAVEFFVLEGSKDTIIQEFNYLNPLFEAICASSSIKEVTLSLLSFSNQKSLSGPSLEGLSAHTSLRELRIVNCLTTSIIACHILRALQMNTSVEYLVISIDFEVDSIVDSFGALVRENKSLLEIKIPILSVCNNSDGLVALMEHVSNSQLQNFGIWFDKFSFESTSNISSAVCNILSKNKSLQFLKIPLFSGQDYCVPIAKSLSNSSTLQTLIFKPSCYSPPDESSSICFHLSRSADKGIEVDISIVEAKALGEMLTVNKSLRIIHLPANFCDCSPIITGLAKNTTMEEFVVNKNMKKSAIHCVDYHIARRTIIFQ